MSRIKDQTLKALSAVINPTGPAQSTLRTPPCTLPTGSHSPFQPAPAWTNRRACLQTHLWLCCLGGPQTCAMGSFPPWRTPCMYIVACLCLQFWLRPCILDGPTLLPCLQPCLWSHLLLLLNLTRYLPCLGWSMEPVSLLTEPWSACSTWLLWDCSLDNEGTACAVAGQGAWFLSPCAAAPLVLLPGHSLCCWWGH